MVYKLAKYTLLLQQEEKNGFYFILNIRRYLVPFSLASFNINEKLENRIIF